MLIAGWGAGGCGELDRDINQPPSIAGVGDDGDGEDADAGDGRGEASDGADGGDGSGGSGGDDPAIPNANDGGSDPSAGDAGEGQDRPGISGKLKKKDGEHIEVPVLCVVRVYEPGEVDPSTGEELGSFLEFPMVVWAFPQHFDLTALELGEFGETSGYVAAYCDQDGSGTVDDADRFGGHYPALPMELVPIPGATEVWLHLGALD